TIESAGILQAEKNGLHFLAEQRVIKTPAIAGFHTIENSQILILEWIQQSKPTKKAWQQLGEQLAALHQLSAQQFGFDENNFIGSLPQANTWKKTWTDFFLENRIKPQMQQAMNMDLLPASTLDLIIALWEKQAALFKNDK